MFRSIRTFLEIIIMVAVLPGAGPSLAASPAADELVALVKKGGRHSSPTSALDSACSARSRRRP